MLETTEQTLNLPPTTSQPREAGITDMVWTAESKFSFCNSSDPPYDPLIYASQ